MLCSLLRLSCRKKGKGLLCLQKERVGFIWVYFSLADRFSCLFFPPSLEAGSIYNCIQWLEPLWNQENIFETGVVRANDC